MWLELSYLWIVVFNAVGIPAIHLGISWFFTRLDLGHFDPESALYRERDWERGGEFYQRAFQIRSWKARLPDAAPWFEGFAKGTLSDNDPSYLRLFVTETCRGEAAHYVQIAGILLTLIWNPWPVAAGVIIVYAVFSNLPCILAQRFTRARLRRLLAGRKAKGSGA